MQKFRIVMIISRLRPSLESSAQMIVSPAFASFSSLPSFRLSGTFVPDIVSSIQPSTAMPCRLQKLPISYRWFSTVCLSVLTLMYP